MDGNYSLSDIAAVTDGNRNNGMFGGDWSAWIILFLLFGMFGGGWGGFGGFGGFGGGSGFQGMATRADINEGFALNGLQTGITAIQQGICDSTYALQNSITGGFNTVNGAIKDCCCQTQRAIDGVNFNMAQNTCTLQSGIKSTADLDTVWKLVDVYKNLLKIDMLQNAGEYADEHGYSQDEGYSQRRKRDSMGRYSRNDGMSYESGNSYRRDDRRRDDYSRNGYSGAHERYMDMKQSYRSSRSPESKKEMLEAIDEFMDEIENLMQETKAGADTREERDKIQQRLRKLTEHM